MSNEHEPQSSDYATNLTGAKPYDEARRATADLCRLARLWVAIAESNEEALNPSHAIEYEDETGEELPIRRPAFPLNSNLRKEELQKAVREHWLVWQAGVQRAKEAIGNVPDAELGPMRVEAKLAIMRLARIFFPPIFLLPHEQPGDQLLRPAGPLACRPGGRSNLRRARIEEIIRPLADFSDLMVMYDLRPEAGNGFDPEADSGWTAQRLEKRIGRKHTFVATLRDNAVPPVPGRVRLQPYKLGELLRMADAAEARKDFEAAGHLRTIVASREVPSS